MDIRRTLRQAVTTGKVYLGTRETLKALKEGTCKLVIYSDNTWKPQEEVFDKYGDVPQYQFPGSNFDLGAACGKPFPVAVLSIIDPGRSDILALVK